MIQINVRRSLALPMLAAVALGYPGEDAAALAQMAPASRRRLLPTGRDGPTWGHIHPDLIKLRLRWQEEQLIAVIEEFLCHIRDDIASIERAAADCELYLVTLWGQSSVRTVTTPALMARFSAAWSRSAWSA